MSDKSGSGRSSDRTPSNPNSPSKPQSDKQPQVNVDPAASPLTKTHSEAHQAEIDPTIHHGRSTAETVDEPE